MKRGRQGQPSKPQSAPQPPAALKSDSRRLGKEETGSDPILEDVTDGVQSLSLSAQFDLATAATPFRPFDLLPNELVAAVFTEFVSSNIQPRKRHEAPCRLLRISKRCHEIAAGTPHLWRTIVVWGYLKVRRLRPYIRRSQNVALDVYVYGRFENETPSLVDQLQDITFGLNHWRSLNMRMNNHKMVCMLLSELPSNLNLETLRIKSNRPANAVVHMLYPKLETLVLKGLHLDWRKLYITSLQRVEVELRQLNDTVWASFVAFLKANTRQLRYLSIRLGERVIGRPTGEELQLALLDTLRITDMTGAIAGTLLHVLEAPCLKSLELSGNGIEGASWYLEDKLKSVEELKLHDFACSEDVVVSLLKQLPSLRRVSMRTEGVRPNQVHSLMELNSSKQIAWRIRLTAEDCSIDEETTDGDFEAAQQELAWLATNSDFSIKDFQRNNVIHSKRLPIMQWNLVDDPEWGKKVWLPPV